jgi:PiT family inorganic phosphate transporter
VDVVAIAAALGLAFVLGVSDAANASAALVVSRAAGWRTALTFSFVFHVLGALAGGTAVAVTISSLVHVSAGESPSVYAAAALAAVGFVTVAARRGIPASATYGLIGGLVGAALVAGGWGAIHWGGIHGHKPIGVFGAIVGLVASPLLGLACGWILRRALVRGLGRGTRRLLQPVRGGIWVAAALVAISDGANDGQKSMGLAVAVLLATGSIDDFHVPIWVRVAAALSLALGTAVGGGRVIRRVGTGYFRPSPIDALAAQVSAAGVILGAALVGAPVSTSETVAASVVGVGADRHPRHVRWAVVAGTLSAWVTTLPACAALGALFYLCARLFT